MKIAPLSTKKNFFQVRGASFFAPAGRATDTEIQELATLALESPVVKVVLDAVNGLVLILNQQRQVLAANQTLLDSLNINHLDQLVGHRPGELLECQYCQEGPDGCGTSKKCKYCGAVLAILAAQKTGRSSVNECWLTSFKNGKRESFEYTVRVTPLMLGGHKLVAMVLNDISSQKRRTILERVFFHDIRNTLTGLFSLTELLQEESSKEVAEMILTVVSQLNKEIDNQYIISKAEQGDLIATPETIIIKQLFDDIHSFIAAQFKLHNIHLTMVCSNPDITLQTDSSLLMRVLINMLKNAMEASDKGETVRCWVEQNKDTDCFFVHNNSFIPPHVSNQIFQRSFSTKKEAGRGIGTYSMKLLGEKYLGGTVSFVTHPQDGTCFKFSLPRHQTL